jgi:uncharacterized protein (UPF0264 family)
MSLFLASVTNVEEAQIALEFGVDVIDLKNPEQGALGALPATTIEQITGFIAGRSLVSATVGDLPMQPQLLLDAVEVVAATGVDMVKIGFFDLSQQQVCLQALQQVARRGVKLIAVLFADNAIALNSLVDFSAAGFYGVMLDTAGKNEKGLRDLLPASVIADFVREGRRLDLFVGLAGSLQPADIAPLSALQPDYLGFRGALCIERQRTAPIDRPRMQTVHSMLRKYHAADWRVAA